MGPKTGTKKSAKSEDELKKKDGGGGGKSSKKSTEDNASNDPSSGNDTKTGTANLVRGASQIGSPDENTNREPGVSISELSHHTEPNRQTGELGMNSAENNPGTPVPEADIKYEEPILPNLIILEQVDLKIDIESIDLLSNRYEGGKEKGLFEGYGKATYVGGHTYIVREF